MDEMLHKHGAKSAASRVFGAFLMLAVIPALLLNVGAGRALLIHDHDDEHTHTHLVTAAAEDEHDHGQDDPATDGHYDHDSGILVLGNDLARSNHSNTSNAPAIIHALPALPSILNSLAVRPAWYYSIGETGAGLPHVSLASQTCVQILI
jgi:hypothetical protein